MEGRIKSIDILRGLATIWMIVFHSYVILTPMNFGLLGELIIHAATMFTTFFVLAAGSAFFLFMNKKNKEELAQTEIFKKVFKRAIFILIVTFAFQLIGGFLGVSKGITWNLFYDVAISMIVLFKIPFLKQKFRYIAYFSLFFTFFLLTHLFNYLLYTHNIGFLFFLISGGSFPILPWINFFLFGLVVGDFIANSSRHRYNIDILIILSIGISLIILWLLGASEIEFLTIHWFFWGIGTYLTLFSVFHYLSDIKNRSIFLEDRVIQWGRLTFTVYYFHFSIIIALTYIFNFLMVGLLNLYQYFILVFIFTGALDIIFRIWYKYNYKFGLEWSMRKFADFSFTFKKNKEEFN